jgi:hypothetical protein
VLACPGIWWIHTTLNPQGTRPWHVAGGMGLMGWGRARLLDRLPDQGQGQAQRRRADESMLQSPGPNCAPLLRTPLAGPLLLPPLLLRRLFAAAAAAAACRRRAAAAARGRRGLLCALTAGVALDQVRDLEQHLTPWRGPRGGVERRSFRGSHLGRPWGQTKGGWGREGKEGVALQ